MPTRSIPKLVDKQLIVNGEPFIALGGEVHNSSASSLAYMERVWDRLVELRLNTAIVPVYWELVEPEEGRYDFELLDGIVEGARAHGMKLVPLWFGTWKNADSTYAPAWVKTDLTRFFRAQGRTGATLRTISSLCDEACRADARAFAAVMKHVREIDEDRQTVVLVQVENETGILGTPRDFGPASESAFAGSVPTELTRHLADHPLVPEMEAIWRARGQRPAGTWTEVFGQAADEVFMAWHVAKYVGRVTALGKAEYPIPMYANCWLVGSDGEPPGTYPSGGPVSRMMDVWRAAAPDVDLYAPDIYRPDFDHVCRQYARSHNPLFIPEARKGPEAAANVFYALGQHDAVGFAPFAIEDCEPSHPIARSYELLGPMLPLIARHQGKGTMIGIYQGPLDVQHHELGAFRLRVRLHRPRKDGELPAGGLVILLAPDELLVVGFGFSVDLLPVHGNAERVDWLCIEEGVYESGRWKPGRRLNGDELGIDMPGAPGAVIAKAYRHA
jgi:beta-galactosidase GanA